MDTSRVEQVIGFYAGENIGVQANIRKMLNSGALGGSGLMMVLAVDQGIEHGPDASFAVNTLSYNPLYHHLLAIAYGYSAYAAPLGMLKCSGQLAGHIPTILKVNGSNSLYPASREKSQSVSATVEEALRIGCSAIGFTIYPGCLSTYKLIEKFSVLSEKAASYGLPSVVWSYARGEDIAKEHETAVDVISYCAHIAAQIGAHIIKVKIPDKSVRNNNFKHINDTQTHFSNISNRIAAVIKGCFDGRRIVIFSGGATKDDKDLLDEIAGIKQGGGFGSIIGRNIFQRDINSSATITEKMIRIYSQQTKLNFSLQQKHFATMLEQFKVS